MRGRLCLLEGEARPEVVEMSPDTPISLGRSRDNTIVIPRDEHTSRLHAKISFENGRWMVRDFGLNGTKVDNERIDQVAELDHGMEVRIGDVRFRFTTPDKPGLSSVHKITADKIDVTNTIPISTTKLHVDELSTLCQFMASAVEAIDPHELIHQGLQTLKYQTGACLVGFLSLDPTDPMPKMIIPETATVDVHLSRLLTRRIQREGKPVWLGGDSSPTRPASESLTPFDDALCLPLKAGGESLGALHVYKTSSVFADKDVRFCEALAGYLAHALHVLKEKRKLEAENTRLRSHLSTADDLLGDSPAMVNLRTRITRAATQQFTVLIQGESGTGKELVALALHRRSPRNGGPFVVVNCAAIPSSLMEAELFGYRRGAFSGAERDHPGLFQQADEGTLFLDEIGELSADCQAKLLRVIEGKAFRPIGATSDIKSDVRIVAATNRNLEAEVKSNHFRQDLYFRLKVIEINVPPLRDRPEDIPYLVQYFLDKLAIECRRTVHLTSAALKLLQDHPWPGNVRQLRAMLESTVAMSDTDTIDVDNVKRMLTPHQVTDTPPSLNWEELEHWAVDKALKQTSGNVSQAAIVLGMSRDTLHTKIKKFGINRVE
ncbi:MAG: sigma 54-interacting transcriptional regulator [Planctomycetes bacterium]|nr:sigma 54-interacting transcriptional regulator [Planctomycetota bacterium]